MAALPVNHIPLCLHDEIKNLWQRIEQEAEGEQLDWLKKQLAEKPSLGKELATAIGGSRFFADQLQRRFSLLQDLVDSDALWTKYPKNHYQEYLQGCLERLDDEAALNQCLRRLRLREMLRLIYRDFNRLASMEETTDEISWLADACIDAALDWHCQDLAKSYGTPMSRPSSVLGEQPQQMVVLGMGKLGAFELNLSSDIDLIFTYPEEGETRGGARDIDNQKFFLKLGQRVIKSLDAATADGFVFRVDMRLRPYGQSGALALSFDAMEEYYQDQGRDWERYAMIKARVVAGDREAGKQLMAALRPFTYRRYIDFSAIDALREMKAMINREVVRRGKNNDVKLGAGGIREIEFIAQSFQLIRGGRDTQLQERQVQKVLNLLAQKECLPEEAVEQLQQAYRFLRNTEHGIQGYMDKQTQALPENEFDRQRLAFVMGFANWDCFYDELEVHREHVHQHYMQVISSPDEEDNEDLGAQTQWLALWSGELDEVHTLSLLKEAGFEDAQESARRLLQLHESNQLRSIQAIGRERLNQFMPLLLQAVAQSDEPSMTLIRLLPFVEAVVRRTAYLVLLVENPQALHQLVVLCAASPWIAQQLAQHPVLLDELLNTGTLYATPDAVMLRQDLLQQMLRIPWDDLEAHMEGLRYYKLAHVLRIAASEVSGKLPLMKVSDYLSYIAEAVLEHVLALVWQQLTARHGRPRRADGEVCDPDFIIVAYGKMGGKELSYGSDLDLVFIHDADANRDTDGEKPIEGGVFFARLGQRIIHILNTQTHLGQLYEVDMRLRPSGAKGLLVSSLKAFSEYQNNNAWTWEHQALVRARVVAGCPNLQQKFEKVREEILCRERDLTELKEKVTEMRDKMADNLIPAKVRDEKNGLFHLKHSRGAIVDIEFMVQYAVLAWAQQHPALINWTDNIRLLEALQEAGLFTSQEAGQLEEAYKAYRSATHRLALQKEGNEVPLTQFSDDCAAVLNKWTDLFG